MKKTSLALAALMLAAAFPLQAQVQTAPAEKPEARCPCDSSTFKPLNDKARSVADYWAARRKYKSTSGIAGMVALFGIVARDPRAMNEAQNALSAASSELHSARAKAEGLGGIKTTNGDDKTVEIKLVKGVDYTLTP